MSLRHVYYSHLGPRDHSGRVYQDAVDITSFRTAYRTLQHKQQTLTPNEEQQHYTLSNYKDQIDVRIICKPNRFGVYTVPTVVTCFPSIRRKLNQEIVK